MRETANLSLRDAAMAPELFVRPRLCSADLLAYFWLAKVWMIAAALPVLLAGLVLASRLEPSPVASVRLEVSQSGEPAANAQLMQAAGRIKAVERAMQSAGEIAVDPDQPLWVGVQRNRSALALRLAGSPGSDPGAALDAVIDRFLATGPVTGRLPPASPDQSAPPSRDDAINLRRDFLARHGLTDFDAEMDRLNAILQVADAALVDTEAKAAAVARRRAALDRQIQDTPATLEDAAPDQEFAELTQLERERDRLLERYTPQSVPVQSIDRQIAVLRARIATGDGAALTSTTSQSITPNPVHAALIQDRMRLDTEQAAVAGELQALRRRRSEAAEALQALSALEPEWRSIERALQRAGDPAVAADAPIDAPLQFRRADRVTVSDGAEPWRRRIQVTTGIASGLLALLAGILYARTRRTFATPNSVARTLNRPVIAAIPKRR